MMPASASSARLQQGYRSLGILACAAAGGALLHALGAPLGWMLGAIAATALATRVAPTLRPPDAARTGARLIIGVLVGSSVTPQFLQDILTLWPAIAIVCVYTFVLMWLGRRYFQRHARFDSPTAFFASVPGALSEMLALSGGPGGPNGNTLAITTTHLVRFVMLMLGIGVVSHLAQPAALQPAPVAAITTTPVEWLLLGACAAGGYWLARRLHTRMGMLLFPALLSGIVHAAGLTQAHPPDWLIACCQIVIGAAAGSRLRGLGPNTARDLLSASFIWSVLLFSMTLLAALAAHHLFGWPLLSTLLALAPGGITEISVIALGLDADMTLVITAQLSRQILILAFTQIALRRLTASPDSAFNSTGRQD